MKTIEQCLAECDRQYADQVRKFTTSMLLRVVDDPEVDYDAEDLDALIEQNSAEYQAWRSRFERELREAFRITH